jgi:predicted RNase H-like HicB family nuclease
MELTAVLTHAEEGGFIALNPETGTTTQGETVEEAVANLKEATALYLSEFPMPSVGHLRCPRLSQHFDLELESLHRS